MKKQLMVALGLAVVATPAFATKARLEALGEDNFGSYYVNDNRNIFLNPAKINEQKDLVTFEFGSSSTGGDVTADSQTAPKAEGGIIKGHGNLVYGAHFGNTTPLASSVRHIAAGGTTALQERNPIDVFVGGDAGMKWGANLTYENTRTTGDDSISSNALRTRFGVVAGDAEAFAQVSLKGDAKDFVGSEIEGKSSYFIGGGYLWNNYKFFADYKSVAMEYRNSSTANEMKDWDLSELRLGVGRQERLNDKATLFARLNLFRQVIEDDGPITFSSAGVGAGERTTYTLPINIGLEYDATSWLILRTSVGQNLWSKRELDPKTGRDQNSNVLATVVRAGATLKFGEFTIDGLISTDSDGDGDVDATTSNGVPNTNDNGNGTLRTDSLMTRVAATYRF